ncbi:ribonuclease H-like domain-containing protein [Sphingomonas antarctica]|uniref:ribonuclease H-like domain-containing protein n=1 Tax=Sphingomonas antarctica TaxID=2040274 RepID=UPI0039E82C67
MADDQFPPWPTHQPVAVGFAEARQSAGGWTFDIDAMVAMPGTTDEAAMIREADRRMAAAEIVTTFNGRQFDALVLRLAAQRLQLWDLPALADHAASNRFGGEHADLADLYASYGRKVSLSSICDQIGIPVKTDVHGSQVGALWATGEHERIRLYVMEDAVATLCLYLAWIAGRSGDETLVTRPLAALAQHIEATPELSHLQPFVDCQLTTWARPRAMVADITAALRRVTNRLKRQEEERAFATS